MRRITLDGCGEGSIGKVEQRPRDESIALEDPTDSAYCGRTVESNPWLSIRLEMAGE